MVPRRLLAVAIAVTAGVAATGTTSLGAITPGHVPAMCRGNVFADQIGTDRGDRMRATGSAERLFGLAGRDWLRGSEGRVACLFGGLGRDRVDLDGGGGVAYGEAGEDSLTGSAINDQLNGGGGLDVFDVGLGDDRIDSRDGLPEVVYCRGGNDLVTADRIDVLIACETVVIDGPDALRLSSHPLRVTRARQAVHVSMLAPFAARAGAYRVVIVTDDQGKGCLDGPVTVARSAARMRFKEQLLFEVRPPKGEHWCPGGEKAAVLLHRAHRPPRPVARFAFGT